MARPHFSWLRHSYTCPYATGSGVGAGSGCAGAQDLRQQVRAIAADAQGRVSTACRLAGTDLNCDLNAHGHPPMQSVFKLPLAIAVLHQVEQGKFTLDQPVRFLPSDRILPHAHSPLWDKYPNANVDVPLRELLRLSVSLSDNVAADILLRLAGGPAVVDRYIASLGVRGFHLVDDEKALHEQRDLQYRNWFEPAGAVELLRVIDERSPLNAADTAYLREMMTAPAEETRLGAELPKGTPVEHKTGTSDVYGGLARRDQRHWTGHASEMGASWRWLCLLRIHARTKRR